MAPMVGGKARSRQKRLDTACAPAIAGRPRPFLRREGRQGIVAPLAGNRIGADQHPATNHDAAAAPGPEDDPEYDSAARRLDIAPERPPVQPHRIGVLNQSGLDNDRPRDGDAHRSGRPDLALDSPDKGADRGDRAGIIADRGRNTLAPMHAAVVVERRRLDFGAAEVDADPKHRHAWNWSFRMGRLHRLWEHRASAAFSRQKLPIVKPLALEGGTEIRGAASRRLSNSPEAAALPRSRHHRGQRSWRSS